MGVEYRQERRRVSETEFKESMRSKPDTGGRGNTYCHSIFLNKWCKEIGGHTYPGRGVGRERRVSERVLSPPLPSDPISNTDISHLLRDDGRGKRGGNENHKGISQYYCCSPHSEKCLPSSDLLNG